MRMSIGFENLDGHTDIDEPDFMTIGQLIDLCAADGDLPVYFRGVDYTIGDLESWRGSYCLPAITPKYCKGSKGKLGKDVAEQLSSQLDDIHTGYKGGEYRYCESDVFYITDTGCAQEYSAVHAEIQDDKIVIFTAINKY